MTILIVFGIIVFLGIHLIPLYPKVRNSLTKKMGEVKYKVVFSLISLSSLSLMFTARFIPGQIHGEISLVFLKNINVLMLIANLLIVSAYIPKNHFKKYLRHPMLIGIFIWSTAHFQINNNLNHNILFIGLMIFSIIMFCGLIKRDGKVDINANFKYNIIAIILGIVSYVAIFYTHGLLIGKVLH